VTKTVDEKSLFKAGIECLQKLWSSGHKAGTLKLKLYEAIYD